MQLKTADFAPVPPPGDLDQSTLSDVTLMLPPGQMSLFLPLYGNTTPSTQSEVLNYLIAMATNNIYTVQKIWSNLDMWII